MDALEPLPRPWMSPAEFVKLRLASLVGIPEYCRGRIAQGQRETLAALRTIASHRGLSMSVSGRFDVDAELSPEHFRFQSEDGSVDHAVAGLEEALDWLRERGRGQMARAEASALSLHIIDITSGPKHPASL